jgi:hypothetical protein
MEVKVTLREIVIEDKATGIAYTVKTLRSAKDIAEYIEESEKEEIAAQIEEAIDKAYHK